MKKNFDHCLKMLLHHEGGFTADKFDPGNDGDGYGNQGSTNMGVTAKVYAAFTGQPAPIEVMQQLTVAEMDRESGDVGTIELVFTVNDWNYS